MKTINYFDLGLHKNAGEIDIMINSIIPLFKDIQFNIFGIEAHPEYTKNLKEKYKNYNNVIIENFAISNKTDKIKLYIEPRTGLGNSIFSTKNNVNPEKFLDVESTTFSDYLINNNINLDSSSCNILKFNIEGAELYLWEDIVKSNLTNKIDIICGSGIRDINKVFELKNEKTLNYYNQLLIDINFEKKFVYFCDCNPNKSINEMKDNLNKILIS